MLRKRYQLNWMFECPDAVLTCSIVNCRNEKYLVFGGHDKTLYLMDSENNIIDDRVFDGWCRCTFPVDLDGDGCDEILVGAGDGNTSWLQQSLELLSVWLWSACRSRRGRRSGSPAVPSSLWSGERSLSSPTRSSCFSSGTVFPCFQCPSPTRCLPARPPG